MEIKKPVAFAVVAIVLVLVLAGVWFFAGSAGSGESVPQSAYPKASDGPGVEAYGIQPPDNRAQPAEAIPLEGSGKR
ncbi:MAG: hypothetical protein SNJ72_09345 [Fimbriimonadales bacterium]